MSTLLLLLLCLVFFKHLPWSSVAHSNIHVAQQRTSCVNRFYEERDHFDRCRQGPCFVFLSEIPVRLLKSSMLFIFINVLLLEARFSHFSLLAYFSLFSSPRTCHRSCSDVEKGTSSLDSGGFFLTLLINYLWISPSAFMGAPSVRSRAWWHLLPGNKAINSLLEANVRPATSLDGEHASDCSDSPGQIYHRRTRDQKVRENKHSTSSSVPSVLNLDIGICGPFRFSGSPSPHRRRVP